MKSINIDELSKLFDRITSKLKAEGYENIQIEDDFYRLIPTESWQTFKDVPIVNGSLYDDVESLKKLTQDEKRICTYVDFDRMASLLRYISQKNNPV